MIKDMEITTGAYDKPLVTKGIFEESVTALTIKWKQTHEGDDEISFYEIKMDKQTGVAVVRRSGQYTSELIFDTSKRTEGSIDTPYGTIKTDIKTSYITLPSVMSPKFEISYEMGADDIKNVFTVKFI